jgi:hypothetical protein
MSAYSKNTDCRPDDCLRLHTFAGRALPSHMNTDRIGTAATAGYAPAVNVADASGVAVVSLT